MKPIFGVVFIPDVPIDLATFNPIIIDTPAGRCATLRCTEVRETSFGLLQLVPAVEAGNPALALYVPAGYILYMLRADEAAGIGFLPAAR